MNLSSPFALNTSMLKLQKPELGMALRDTGQTMTDTDFTQRARALDQSNHTVIVIASAEAIEDYGWTVAMSAASKKYDAGDFQIVDGVRQVRVLSGDCNA